MRAGLASMARLAPSDAALGGGCQRVLPQVLNLMEGVRERGDAAVREFSGRSQWP
jgi:hypothetical protein